MVPIIIILGIKHKAKNLYSTSYKYVCVAEIKFVQKLSLYFCTNVPTKKGSMYVVGATS